MDGALGRHPDVTIQPPDQELTDLAGSPMWLLGFQADDQAFELLRQLVGVRTGRRDRSVRASSPWSLYRPKTL